MTKALAVRLSNGEWGWWLTREDLTISINMAIGKSSSTVALLSENGEVGVWRRLVLAKREAHPSHLSRSGKQ